MRRRYPVFILCLIVLLAVTGCGKKDKQEQQPAQEMGEEVTVLKIYPMDSLAGIISRSGDLVTVGIDPQVSTDGNGSLMMDVAEPTTIRFYETGDVDIENVRLIYRAMLRTANVEGQVYLEMWCHFPGMGEAFSRGLPSALSGTNNWVTVETPFLLKAGENPDNIKLNLVFEGTGTAWIDDVQLLLGSLQ